MKTSLEILFFISLFSLHAHAHAAAETKCDYVKEENIVEGDLPPSLIDDKNKTVCVATLACETELGVMKKLAACPAESGSGNKWNCPAPKACQKDETVSLDIQPDLTGGSHNPEASKAGTQ